MLPLSATPHIAYQWMVDFVDELVAPADDQAAETLFIALHGKGAYGWHLIYPILTDERVG